MGNFSGKAFLIFRVLKYILVAVVLFLIVTVIIKISPALWNRWVVYPGLEKDRQELWNQYQVTPQVIEMSSFKGVLHTHTYWSHDSRGVLPEILDAAKKAELTFMFNSDHKRHQLDTFPRGYHGIYDGIIIEAGTEHGSGLMINPFDSSVVDWSLPEAEIMKNIMENGGLVTYVHTEEDHDWESPYYHAMEIYNIHTDLLDEAGILPFVINSTINGGQYMHWAFRELFDEQVDILANWDRLNDQRQVVGIAAVDAHNNQSFRARFLDDGQVEWVGPNADTLVIRKATWWDQLLMGEPDKYGWAFKWEMDPYFNSYNFVNNYVFADTLTNISIRDHIKKGHVYTCFVSLAKGDGFQYYALNSGDSLSAILGDSVKIAQLDKLQSVSPFPVQFELYQNGNLIDTSALAYEYDYPIEEIGNYRLLARIELGDKLLPWIYTNPIYVY